MVDLLFDARPSTPLRSPCFVGPFPFRDSPIALTASCSKVPQTFVWRSAQSFFTGGALDEAMSSLHVRSAPRAAAKRLNGSTPQL